MKKLGEIFDKNGKVSKILLKNEDTGKYHINEINEEGKMINEVTLDQEEFNKLHLALSKIENYWGLYPLVVWNDYFGGVYDMHLRY